MTASQDTIRKEKRYARQQIDNRLKQQYSTIICNKIIQGDFYQQSQHIAVYFALPEEVNLQSLIEDSWQQGKNIYLPVVIEKDKPLLFAPYYADTPLTKDTMNIDIPSTTIISPSNYITADKLDIIITPLVSFDKNCSRIGMGGGFYDRTFAEIPHNKRLQQTRIGVAFEAQRSRQAIIPQEWDKPLDAVFTETTSYSHKTFIQ